MRHINSLAEAVATFTRPHNYSVPTATTALVITALKAGKLPSVLHCVLQKEICYVRK